MIESDESSNPSGNYYRQHRAWTDYRQKDSPTNAVRTASVYGRCQWILMALFGAMLLAIVPCPDRAIAGSESAAQPNPYGIETGNMTVTNATVAPGQNLSGILLAAGTAFPSIHSAIGQCKGIFDVNKIQAGAPYCLMKDPETGETRYFIYEKDFINFVVFNISENKVSKGRKPIETRLRLARGCVGPSLSSAFHRLGLDFDLVKELADIYACSLDFYHFKTDDQFRVIFEEKRVGDRHIGYGRIRAAQITTKGRDYYAFYFNKSGNSKDGGQYYDENGHSLQKSFLKAPLEYVRISSGYSKSRLHPILGYYRPHLGIDFAAPTGTPVMSVADGVVLRTGYNKGMGNFIEIRHFDDRYASQYLHLSKIVENIQPGAAVTMGQVIGKVGSTGLATGPHLDFRFRVDGKLVDYLNYDIPIAMPIKASRMRMFEKWTDIWLAELDKDTVRFSQEHRIDKTKKPKG